MKSLREMNTLFKAILIVFYDQKLKTAHLIEQSNQEKTFFNVAVFTRVYFMLSLDSSIEYNLTSGACIPYPAGYFSRLKDFEWPAQILISNSLVTAYQPMLLYHLKH